MYIGLQTNYPLFLSDFNETWILSIFSENPNIQFHENPSAGSQVVSWGGGGGGGEAENKKKIFRKSLRGEPKFVKKGGEGGGGAEGRTDMKNLTVAVRNFVKGPKKECVLNKNIPGFSNEKETP